MKQKETICEGRSSETREIGWSGTTILFAKTAKPWSSFFVSHGFQFNQAHNVLLLLSTGGTNSIGIGYRTGNVTSALPRLKLAHKPNTILKVWIWWK